MARALVNKITPRAGDKQYALLLPPLGAVLVLLLLVFFVWFDTFAVDGDSMLPTLRPEDRLLVTRGYDEPVRGDVVVAAIGGSTGREDVIKRVAAIAGDVVVVEGDSVTVNGTPAPPNAAIVGDRTRARGTILVPDGQVFLLGDNRPVSRDSRFVGPVLLSEIRGRVVAIYSPVTRIRRVDVPAIPD